MYFSKFDWPRIDVPEMSEKSEKKSLHQIKKCIKERGDDLAAIIIEPIQAEGGDKHFRKEFFKALRVLCDENDMLLIFDEIQTGMGMTGKMWAWQHFGVAPDLMSFGKKAQVCGFLSGKRIDEVEKNVFHESTRIDSTWGGNLVDMVRATIYLEVMEEEKILENVVKQGAYFLKKLKALQDRFPKIISQVRGRGLMCAMDLPTTESRNRFIKEGLKQKIVLLAGGEKTIRFRPPLTIQSSEIDVGVLKIFQLCENLFI